MSTDSLAPYKSPQLTDAESKRPSGWLMVCLAALMMVGTLPGRTHGLGLVSTPLMADLGLDAVEFADINLWATLIGAVFSIPCGWMLDRYGLRLPSTLVVLGLGAVVALMSRVTGAMELLVVVTLTRALGQTMLSVVSLTTVGAWFPGARSGSAMGVYALLMGVGFMIAFPAVGELIKHLGWRDAWAAVGIILLVVVAPLCAAFVRTPPKALAESQANEAESLDGASFTSALTTTCFWTFALASSFYGLLSSGIALFNQAILAELGFTADTYYATLAIGAIIGVLFNLLGGLALRWVSLRLLMAAGMTVLAGAMFLLPLAKSESAIYANAVAAGAAGGIITVVFFAIWAYAYGRRHLGRIQGAAQMLTVVASAVGPLVVAEAQSASGSYLSVYPWFGWIAVGFGVVCLFTPIPQFATARLTPAT